MATLPGYDYDHLFIDNASTDKTVEILRELAATDQHVKVIVNTRNFGHIRSPYHAFLQARGDAVMSCVADLQDPPELIPQFVKKWEEGYKVVIGVKQGSQEFLAHVSHPEVLLLARRPGSRRTSSSSTTSRASASTTATSSSSSASTEEQYPYFRGLVSDFGYARAEIHVRPARARTRARRRTTSSASTTSRCSASPTTPRCRCAWRPWPASRSRCSAC